MLVADFRQQPGVGRGWVWRRHFPCDLPFKQLTFRVHAWLFSKTSWLLHCNLVYRLPLKLNIQKTKIMTSGPITSWQINGETVETVADFILGGSKITADGDCSHEIKIRLLLGRKVMTNVDSILKSRDITLPAKVHLVKAKVFPVVMYGCESWTIEKAERWRIDDFELWCWRRLLRVPWTPRRSNQSILKEISSGCSLEGLMLKLKLQYFDHVLWRADSFEKTLMLGKNEGGRRRGWQRMRWLDGQTRWTWLWANSGSWWWTGRPGVLQSMGSQRVGHDWATERRQQHPGFRGVTQAHSSESGVQGAINQTSSRYMVDSF